jgi:O-antigen/teichoic acid export membrane protein
MADQALAVGGMFLANVALARTQSKEEYGIFALSYSVFTFLAGLHNAAILETYTIYGSGRYHEHFPEYAWLLWKRNILLGLGLSALVVATWGALAWTLPAFASRTILGLALSCGVLLTASFVRRTFYIRRRPDLAARFSFVFFAVCLFLLWLCMRAGILNGFYAFVIVALAWTVAGASMARELPGNIACRSFTEIEPKYWSEHWKYARWVFVTAFVFQLTTQGYYWLAAGFLSVKEAGDLRAMFNVVAPVDQVFIAMSFLILPMMARRHASHQLAGLLPLWRVYSVGCLLVTGGFAALVNLFGRPAMHYLYAGRFDDIAPSVGTLALLPVVMTLGNTMNEALKASEKPKLVFYAYVCSGCATFLLGIPLVMHFGLHGAVYGTLLSAATYTSALAVGFLLHVHQKAQQHA